MRNITKKIVCSSAMYWVVFLLTIPLVTEAYIDPGTGSLIIQAAIAFIAGALFFTKSFWGRMTNFFRHNFYKKKEPDDTSMEDGDKKLIL